MSIVIVPKFRIHKTEGAEVHPGNSEDRSQKIGGWTWYLQIPTGPQGDYRVAQLDDYSNLRRRHFPWQPPIILSLRARSSTPRVPGTWGFGLWNDPFSLSLGFGGGSRRVPTLPNAAWFFFASSQNYLSFRDDKPAQGFLAQTFRSTQIPTPLLACGAMTFPLLLWPGLARKLRPLFRGWIEEDSFTLKVDVTQWHEYSLEWHIDRVTFRVDDQTIETAITPKPPLGFVIWIDNQFAAFPSNGRLSFGSLENPHPAWLEIENLSIIKGLN